MIATQRGAARPVENRSERSRHIDWDRVRAATAAAAASADAAGPADPEAAATLLAERAQSLAARRREGRRSSTSLRGLVVRVGTERCAVPAGVLVEILPLPRITPVPGAPPALLGIAGLRGDVRSVVSLAEVLHAGAAAPQAAGYLVLVRLGTRQVGLQVDEVERFCEIAVDTLAPLSGSTAGMIRGVTPDGIAVLDQAHVFAHPVFHGRGAAARTSAKRSPS